MKTIQSRSLPRLLTGAIIILVSRTAPAQTLPPATIQYQGRVSVAGAAHDGAGYFKFLLFAPDKRLWSNDDSHGGAEPLDGYEPAGSVSVSVSVGLFSADLGSGAMPAITPGVFFDGTGNVRSEVNLRIWFSAAGGGGTFVKLSPDRRLSSVPFALVAGTVARGAVTNDKLAPDAVTRDKIKDGEVVAGKIGAGAVAAANLAQGAVTANGLQDASVIPGKLATGSVALDNLTGGVKDRLVPSGSVSAFAGSVPPAGWLLCDGSVVSRATYAALLAAIGTAHGSGNGTTTFNLPDYRGMFLRGLDSGADFNLAPAAVDVTANSLTIPNHGFNHDTFPVRLTNTGGALPGPLAADTTYFVIMVDQNIIKLAATEANALAGNAVDFTSQGSGSHKIVSWADPDRNGRRAMAAGGNAAGSVGSVQGDDLKSHTHTYTALARNYGVGGGGSGNPGSEYSSNTSAAGGNETRPKNAAVNYIIKY